MATPDVLAVLRRVLIILQERGWAPLWSIDKRGPLNLRCAVSVACSDLVGDGVSKQWYDLYLDTTDVLRQCLHNGIISWEGMVKAPAEVEKMLIEVITRLENDEIHPRHHRGHRYGPV